MTQGLPPHFLRFVLRRLVEDGHAAHALLDGLDLTAADLEDEHFRLSLEQHERFVHRALDLTGDAHLGIDLVRRHGVQEGGVWMLASLNGGSVAEVLRLVARYDRIYTRAVTVEALDLEDTATLMLGTALRDVRVAWFGLGSFVSMLDRMFAHLLRDESLILGADFAVPAPDDAARLPSLLPFQVRFGAARTCIRLDPDLLDRRTRQTDPVSVRLLQEASERQLEAADAEEAPPLVGQVRALIVEHLSQPLGLDASARRLALSPRSLRRRLAEAGTSYQQILDAVRLDVARRLLRETGAPIAHIAETLGFESPSHFGRAFKRWTGHAPSRERRSG